MFVLTTVLTMFVLTTVLTMFVLTTVLTVCPDYSSDYVCPDYSSDYVCPDYCSDYVCTKTAQPFNLFFQSLAKIFLDKKCFISGYRIPEKVSSEVEFFWFKQ